MSEYTLRLYLLRDTTFGRGDGVAGRVRRIGRRSRAVLRTGDVVNAAGDSRRSGRFGRVPLLSFDGSDSSLDRPGGVYAGRRKHGKRLCPFPGEEKGLTASVGRKYAGNMVTCWGTLVTGEGYGSKRMEG